MTRESLSGVQLEALYDKGEQLTDGELRRLADHFLDNWPPEGLRSHKALQIISYVIRPRP